ncbi:MAG: undecaprenyl-diphosphate phosphatase [Thermaerobacter sp.]|nr:undecaprenyl-diphosphate phosphatase [Thermaerobacter sp.]
MTLLGALLAGILQGLTEFLPVSSSGHLAILERLLGVEAGQVGLAIAAHAGTLVAVLWVYGGVLRRSLTAAPTERRRFFHPFVWALVGTAPVALVLAPAAERAFTDPRLVGVGFLVTSGLLLLLPRLPHRPAWLPRPLGALLVGIVQGIAVWPGLSRSGATIAALRGLGADADQAAEFSFLLAIPTVAAALLRELLRGGFQGPLLPLILAAAAAAISGIASLRWTVRLLRQGRLWWFALYTLVLAGVGLWLG